MRGSLLRRSSVTAGFAVLCLAGSTGARPFTKGVSYRIRVSSRLPAIMAGAGGDGAGPLVLARATAVGNRARFDLQAFQPMPAGVSLDDYLLVLDSNRTVFVNADEKTYVEAGKLLGSGGLGMLGAMAGGRRGGGGGGGFGNGTPQMDMTALVTDFEKLAPDTTDGKQTQHYRIVAEMTIGAMGRQVPMRIVIDTWTASVAYHIINPFEGGAAPSSDDPAAKLTAKLAEYRKKIEGTPIKTVMTTTLTIDAGGGPMALDFGQTTTITDIKEMDVDEARFDIPAGFTKKGGS